MSRHLHLVRAATPTRHVKRLCVRVLGLTILGLLILEVIHVMVSRGAANVQAPPHVIPADMGTFFGRAGS